MTENAHRRGAGVTMRIKLLPSLAHPPLSVGSADTTPLAAVLEGSSVACTLMRTGSLSKSTTSQPCHMPLYSA